MIGRLKDEHGIVVYIVYHDGIPHDFITVKECGDGSNKYLRPYYWDVVIKQGDKTDLMLYESGSGGNILEIQAPQYTDGTKGVEYWMADIIGFVGEHKNCTRIKEPKRLYSPHYEQKTTTNPFKMGWEVQGYEYCWLCNQYYNEEWCSGHHTESKAGNGCIYRVESKELAIKNIQKYKAEHHGQLH